MTWQEFDDEFLYRFKELWPKPAINGKQRQKMMEDADRIAIQMEIELHRDNIPSLDREL